VTAHTGPLALHVERLATSLSKVLGRVTDRASMAKDAVTNTDSERAVYDAVVELPLTPERVLSALKKPDCWNPAGVTAQVILP
jgi:hypothetical protein